MVHEPGADSECQWSIESDIDLAGPFPADKHDTTYICRGVAVDSLSFSRFVMAKAIKSTNSNCHG